MNFFVIGMPRSRTAWLANFLTYEKICFHEGLDGCNNLLEYTNKLGTENGDSSTALMMFDIDKLYPDAPKLIIDSDIQRTIDYAEQVFGFCDQEFFETLQNQLNKINGKHIDFKDIDSNLKEIWDYLIGTPFNHERANILKRMRIEVKNPYDYDDNSIKNLLMDLNYVPKTRYHH